MAEQQTHSNPTNTDLGVSSPNIESRVSALLDRQSAERPDDEDNPGTQGNAAQQDAPNDSEQPDALTADDLPDENAPVQSEGGEAWEIVHNGQTVKLSRDEVIAHARQGFDYTQKTQEVAAQRAEANAILQRAAQIEQMVPIVAQDLAAVKSLETQIQQTNAWVHSQGGWVALATNEPLDYSKIRAQYDQLVSAYQEAGAAFQNKATYVVQQRQYLAQHQIATEAGRLPERIPEWKDPAKREAGTKELATWLLKKGADPGRVGSIADSLEVEIAYKAMLYDKLVQSKNDRSKQLRNVPPVSRPGEPAQAQATVEQKKARDRLRRTGDREDAVGLLLTRMNRK